MSIIVSMTSYPGRIKNVGKSIFFLLQKQTLPPDFVHLWLSKQEFPTRETGLPLDLQMILKHPKVKLHWVDKNTYVHKRHEVFKIATDADCVFLIDDDVRYSDDLIKNVINTHTKWPDCIICYNQYSKHEYNGRHIIYGAPAPETKPMANWNRWCGQSMIPAKIYPKEILDAEHQSVRDECDPISDECWIQPWIVYHDIPVFHLNYGWGTDIDRKNGKWSGLCSSTHAVEANGYEKRDNWLYAVLSKYPQIHEKYRRLFNYG